MKNIALIISASLSLSALTVIGVAQQSTLTPSNPMVGGMAMLPTKNIVENAVNSRDHTTLVAAVKAAGLVDALQAKGPLTVFAPTNDAFENLPAGTVESLLRPQNKATLTKVLTAHVVAGNFTSSKLRDAIRAGKGKAELKTLAGARLTLKMNGPTNLVVQDEVGGVSTISTYDVMQSNGVIHVTTGVLLPK